MIKKRVGYYGGTFNPIHHGHLISALYVLEAMALDQLVFLPAKQAPHKEGEKSLEVSLRNEMIELAIEEVDGFAISYEDQKGLSSYSYDILNRLCRKEHEIFFLMGRDSLETITSWYRYKDLLSDFEIIVVDRLTEEKGRLEDLIASFSWAKGIHLVEIPLIEISSTEVRLRRARKAPIDFLVPSKVKDFIVKRALYEV